MTNQKVISRILELRKQLIQKHYYYGPVSVQYPRDMDEQICSEYLPEVIRDSITLRDRILRIETVVRVELAQVTELSIQPLEPLQPLDKPFHLNDTREVLQHAGNYLDEEFYKIAHEYHRECEAYDRTVCTGPIGKDGGIMPRTHNEQSLVNRNASEVRIRIMRKHYITTEQFQKALNLYHCRHYKG